MALSCAHALNVSGSSVAPEKQLMPISATPSRHQPVLQPGELPFLAHVMLVGSITFDDGRISVNRSIASQFPHTRWRAVSLIAISSNSSSPPCKSPASSWHELADRGWKPWHPTREQPSGSIMIAFFPRLAAALRRQLSSLQENNQQRAGPIENAVRGEASWHSEQCVERKTVEALLRRRRRFDLLAGSCRVLLLRLARVQNGPRLRCICRAVPGRHLVVTHLSPFQLFPSLPVALMESTSSLLHPATESTERRARERARSFAVAPVTGS